MEVFFSNFCVYTFIYCIAVSMQEERLARDSIIAVLSLR